MKRNTERPCRSFRINAVVVVVVVGKLCGDPVGHTDRLTCAHTTTRTCCIPRTKKEKMLLLFVFFPVSLSLEEEEEEKVENRQRTAAGPTSSRPQDGPLHFSYN